MELYGCVTNLGGGIETHTGYDSGSLTIIPGSSYDCENPAYLYDEQSLTC